MIIGSHMIYPPVWPLSGRQHRNKYSPWVSIQFRGLSCELLNSTSFGPTGMKAID
jgi:hypothetical protein